MDQHIAAIYQNGVFVPVVPLDLAEHAQVSLIIASDAAAEVADELPLIADEGDPDIGWEEVQQLLAKLPTSLADDFDRERDERF